MSFLDNLLRNAIKKVPLPPPAPINQLTKLVNLSKTPQAVARQMSEALRIIGMPEAKRLTKQEIAEMSKQYILAPAYDDGWRLREEQAEGVKQFLGTRGLFAPIGVGKGKTLLTLLIAELAKTVMHKKKMLLVIPSHLVGQFYNADLKYYRTKINITYEVILLAGRSAEYRRRIANQNRSGLYVMPYSLFSTTDCVETLKAIAPELIIADEVHNFARMDSARTRRFVSYVEKAKPLLAALSGTITRKTLKDYAHLARYALGDNSFVPSDYQTLSSWSDILDSSVESSNGDIKALDGTDISKILPLLSWAKAARPHEHWEDDPEYIVADCRKAFNLRRATCLGVVSSHDTDIGTSITFTNLPVSKPETCEGWQELEGHRKKLEATWETPNGEPIEHAMLKYKWDYELSNGFYNKLTWPTDEQIAKRHRIPLSLATDQLEAAKEHHELHKAYVSEMGKYIRRSRTNPFDTPLLVGKHMADHRDKGDKLLFPLDIYELWLDAKQMEIDAKQKFNLKQLLERDGSFVPVCDFKIKHAIAWAKSRIKEGGIIWYYHIGMGKWMQKALIEAGIDAMYCPASKEADVELRRVGDPSQGGKGNRIVVASMTAHGTGKNLQSFYNQLFLQWPRSASAAEQVLGRIHRLGQVKDEVDVNTNLTLNFDHELFASTLVDSTYIHQTSGSQQKLVYGRYVTPPRTYPSLWLRDRGFNPSNVDFEVEKNIKNKFNTLDTCVK